MGELGENDTRTHLPNTLNDVRHQERGTSITSETPGPCFYDC